MISNIFKNIFFSLFCLFYFEGLAHGVFSLDSDLYRQRVYDHAEFGILDENGENYIFKETNHIPNKVGITYGWNIHLTTHKEVVTWKEEFILPSPAVEWADINKNEVTVDNNKKAAITKRTVIPENGWINNYWSISKGDPSGKYMMKIYIDDSLVKTFVFFIE